MKRWQKWAYAAGNFGPALTNNVVSTYVQFFYVAVLGLSAPLMGTAMLVYALWNSINDPIAGHISDHTRTRWGRRIPYILFLSLPMSVFFALVFIVPPEVARADNLLFIYMLGMLFMFDVLGTFVGLNQVSLFPEMFTRVAERAEVSSYRQVFGLVGGLGFGVVLPPLLYATIGWGALAVLYAALAALTLYVSLAGSKEQPQQDLKEALPLRAAITATLRNYSFLTYLVFQICKEFAALLIMASIPFYARYVLHESESVTSLLLGASFAVAFPMVFVWSRLAVRLGARNAMMWALAAFALALLPFAFVSDLMSTLLAIGAVGIGLGGLFVLPDVLLSDVIDEDEQRTGVRREGMYFGMQGLLLRAGIALQALALSTALTLTGFDAALGPTGQPALVETGLRMTVSLVPMAALALGLVFLALYPLHGRRLAETQRRRLAHFNVDSSLGQA